MGLALGEETRETLEESPIQTKKLERGEKIFISLGCKSNLLLWGNCYYQREGTLRGTHIIFYRGMRGIHKGKLSRSYERKSL